MIDNVNEAKKEWEQGQIIFEKGLKAINNYIKSYLCPEGNKKEFDNVEFRAEGNEVHRPLKTQFGYHLIEITSRSV